MARKLASAVGLALALAAEASERPAARVAGACQGSFPVQGSEATYLAGGGGTVSGSSLRLQHNSGFSIMSQCSDTWQPNDFYFFQWVGHTFSFDVDLSGAGCGCNVAFYLVQTPAKDESGNPSVGSCEYSPYYCDANQVCGQWCPEMDIMEANTVAFQTTPHSCDSPSSSGHYYNCDRSGLAKNTRNLGGNAYGPGSQYQIDTTRQFTVSTTFGGSALGVGLNATASLASIRTVLSQDGRTVVIENTDASYLSNMAWPLSSGMSVRITYWGDSMQWLDGCDGSQTCSKGDVAISNLRFTAADDVVVA